MSRDDIRSRVLKLEFIKIIIFMVIKRAEISSLGSRHELINCQLSGYELKNIPNINYYGVIILWDMICHFCDTHS